MRNRENAKDRQEFWASSIGILKIVDAAAVEMPSAQRFRTYVETTTWQPRKKRLAALISWELLVTV
jgi:hypothetical protein